MAPRLARGAVEFDAVSEQGRDNASLVTFDATVGAGPDRFLLVAIAVNRTSTQAASVTFAGSALTLLGSSDAVSECRIELWGVSNPVSGRHPVNVLLRQSDTTEVAALSYTGVDQIQPVGNTLFDSNQGPATHFTPSAVGEMVVDAICADGSAPTIQSAGQGQRPRWGAPIGNFAAAGGDKPGDAIVNTTWVVNDSPTWVWGAVVLRGAPEPVPDAAGPPEPGPDAAGPAPEPGRDGAGPAPEPGRDGAGPAPEPGRDGAGPAPEPGRDGAGAAPEPGRDGAGAAPDSGADAAEPRADAAEPVPEPGPDAGVGPDAAGPAPVVRLVVRFAGCQLTRGGSSDGGPTGALLVLLAVARCRRHRRARAPHP